MMRIARPLLLVLTALALGGCTIYTLAKADKPITLAHEVTVTPSRDWSKFDEGSVEVWTIDGPLLQRIVIFKGLADGKTLLVRARDNPKYPKFDKAMTALEVRDLFAATRQRRDSVAIETNKLRPAKLGDADGFRFEYTQTTAAGLRMRGFAVGAIINERLYLFDYAGTEIFYFDRYRREAEQLVGSLRSHGDS